ncbi:hypothetical protein IW22_06390 [Chryseobacterium sp. JM1]|nr:hypothetical protein IW22_06390 [Chryseobacterium sp. JM1]
MINIKSPLKKGLFYFKVKVKEKVKIMITLNFMFWLKPIGSFIDEDGLKPVPIEFLDKYHLRNPLVPRS